MSVFELVLVFGVAYQINFFHKVEEELVNRENKLKTKVASLGENI